MQIQALQSPSHCRYGSRQWHHSRWVGCELRFTEDWYGLPTKVPVNGDEALGFDLGWMSGIRAGDPVVPGSSQPFGGCM